MVKKLKRSKQKNNKSLYKISIVDINTSLKHWKKAYAFFYNMVYLDYDKKYDNVIVVFDNENKHVKMKISTLIINLIFWKPYSVFNKPITMDTLYDTKHINEHSITNKFDIIIKEFIKTIELKKLTYCLSTMLELLARVAKDFCEIIGNSLSLRDIIELSDRNPIFNDIIHTKYEENTMTITDIEKDIKKRTDVVEKIMNDDPQCSIRPFMKAGGNINIGQMSQCIVSIGPRSDIFGNISPVIANSNFIRGLESVSDYYIDSYACKKSLIANYYQMADSGYTSRQVDLNCVDSSLVDVEDCGSKKYIELTIYTEKMLRTFEFKKMYVGTDKKGNHILESIDPSVHKHLIGQNVKIRSPITCNLQQGKICKTCYGDLALVNMGYHTGLIGSHGLTQDLSQTVLSTKHLSKTRSIKVEYPEIMQKYFNCSSESITLKSEYINHNIELGFYNEDLEDVLNSWEAEDDDKDVKDHLLIDAVNRFIIVVNDEKIPVEGQDLDLFINPDFLLKVSKSTKIEDSIIYVDISGFTPEQSIFDINVENLEIGIYLKKIMQLFGVKSKMKFTTYEELLKEVIVNILDIGIFVNVVHLESIIYNMVRDPEMIIHRPDFSKDNPNYLLVSIPNSILFNRSLTTSLGFERIKSQLENVYTCYKDYDGFMDPFFK